MQLQTKIVCERHLSSFTRIYLYCDICIRQNLGLTSLPTIPQNVVVSGVASSSTSSLRSYQQQPSLHFPAFQHDQLKLWILYYINFLVLRLLLKFRSGLQLLPGTSRDTKCTIANKSGLNEIPSKDLTDNIIRQDVLLADQGVTPGRAASSSY